MWCKTIVVEICFIIYFIVNLRSYINSNLIYWLDLCPVTIDVYKITIVFLALYMSKNLKRKNKKKKRNKILFTPIQNLVSSHLGNFLLFDFRILFTRYTRYVLRPLRKLFELKILDTLLTVSVNLCNKWISPRLIGVNHNRWLHVNRALDFTGSRYFEIVNTLTSIHLQKLPENLFRYNLLL